MTRLQQVWRAYVVGDPKEHLAWWRERHLDVECRFTIETPTSRGLFLTLCERFGLKPFRRPRMKGLSVCIAAPDGFLDKVFSPVFDGMSDILEDVALQTTQRLVTQWWEGDQAQSS